MAKGGKREGAGRPIATKTLQTQMMREQLTELVMNHLEEMAIPQIEKAVKGDTQAFQAVMSHVLPKLSENKNENTSVKTYRLDDAEAQRIADELTTLQKSNTGTDTRRT